MRVWYNNIVAFQPYKWITSAETLFTRTPTHLSCVHKLAAKPHTQYITLQSNTNNNEYMYSIVQCMVYGM